jgi:hypothetical protein
MGDQPEGLLAAASLWARRAASEDLSLCLDSPDDGAVRTRLKESWLRNGAASATGVWSRIIDALAASHDAAVQMIDISIVRVNYLDAQRPSLQWRSDDILGLIALVAASVVLLVSKACFPFAAQSTRARSP